jgi:hypothetical protein
MNINHELFFVKKLFAFFSKEKATKKPIVSFDRVYQRTSKALGVSYTSVHRIMSFFVAFSLLKKANNFFTNFWHSGDKSDFLPILQKMQNITIIYERNACQVRLKYTWLRERLKPMVSLDRVYQGHLSLWVCLPLQCTVL